MFLIFDFILLVYCLFYLPYLLLTRRWYAGFGMRFGIFSPAFEERVQSKPNIWVHAVSVGEVMVLDGFIDQLKKIYPSYQVIATVTTKTGYQLACERLKDKALVIPSPVDFSFVALNFVSLINPRLYIVVETEIWPNLYRQIFHRSIPMVVINGRISDNSFGRYKLVRFLLKGILNQVSVWCMQSQRDAQRIRDLGAQSLKVIVTGNIKFDDLPKINGASQDLLKVKKDELWWVAGSTHPGEEDIILEVYHHIIKDNPQWRLVIAPRHVERTAQIMELVSRRGFKPVKLTEIAAISEALSADTVIIVDTIGQLRELYRKASLVFVGKSLCVGGGHNVIEPAFYGKAIIVGPKVENFRDIVACFKEANALVQVEDELAFKAAVADLCVHDSKREKLGTAARQVIEANQGATRRTLTCLGGLIK